MRWWLVALLLVCSCTFRREQAPSDGTTTIDDGPLDRDGGPGDAKTPDAPLAITCDPVACAAAGNGTGTCDPMTNHCRISTTGAGGLTCPAGHFCDVTCGGALGCRDSIVNCGAAVGCTVTCGAGGGSDTACDKGVQCPATGPCTVTCNGGDTCRHGRVTCGAGPCNVQCLGVNACTDSGVDCKTSTQCDVRCEGNNACQNAGPNTGVACGSGICNVTCKGNNACQNLPVCTATPTSCAFHCCGANTCKNGMLCSTCTKDAVCP